MNKVFKVIWNAASQTWVAVSELQRVKGKTKSKSLAKPVLVAVSAATAGATMIGGVQAAVSVTEDTENYLLTYDGSAASGFHYISQGVNVTSPSSSSVIYGVNITGYSTDVLVGSNLTTEAPAATIFGQHSKVTGQNSRYAIAVGHNTTAGGLSSLAMGPSANATSQGDVAIGAGASTIAKGHNQKIAIGTNAKAMGEAGIAIGLNAKAYSTQDTLAEDGIIDSAANSNNMHGRDVAIGGFAVATGGSSVAIGRVATAQGSESLAFGRLTYVQKTGEHSASIGSYNNISGAQTNVLGIYNANITGNHSNIVGAYNNLTSNHSNIIGYGNTVTGDNSTVIGTNATVSGNMSIAIGYGNQVTGNNSGAFGDPNTISGDSSYAVGNDNTVANNNTFVLGNEVTTSQDNSVVLGANSADREATAESTATINNLTYSGFAGVGSAANGVVSVGAKGAERQIINVAAGNISENSTDAINGSQLYWVAANLANATQNYFHVNNGSNTGGDSATNFGGVGVSAGATGLYALAAGENAVATDRRSVAVGYNAKVLSTQNNPRGIGHTAVGENTLINSNVNEGAVAIGGGAAVGVIMSNDYSSDKKSTVLVANSETAAQGTAIGSRAFAYGAQSSALSADSWAIGQSSIALGGDDTMRAHSALRSAVAEYAAKTGTNQVSQNNAYTRATGYSNVYDTAVAARATRFAPTAAIGDASIALGTHAQSAGVASNAIGTNAITFSDISNAIGFMAQAGVSGGAGKNANAFGTVAVASGNDSNAIGHNATASGDDSISIGTNSTASGNQSIAIGYANQVTGDNSGAFGDPTVISGNRSYSVGNNNTIANDDTFVLGSTVTTTQNNSVVLGANSTDRAATAETSATVNGVTYGSFAGVGAEANGVVSVGKAGAERQIINVAAGNVSADSTDAINGSQLYLVAEEAAKKSIVAAGENISSVTTSTLTNGSVVYTVNAIDTNTQASVTSNDDSVTITTSTNANGTTNYDLSYTDNDTVTTVSYGRSYNSSAQANAPINVTTSTNSDGSVDYAINVLTTALTVGQNGAVSVPTGRNNNLMNATQIQNAINNSGFQIVTGTVELAGGSGTQEGDSYQTLVTPGDQLILKAGNNLVISQSTDRTVTYALNPDISLNSITINPDLSEEDVGIDMGDTKITNLANGTNPSDAVNLSQLNATKTFVQAGNHTSVNSTTNANGSTNYIVNADNAVVTSTDDSVTVTATSATNADGTTTYTYDLSANVSTGSLSNNANGTVQADETAGNLATVGDVADAINNSGWNTTLSDGTSAQVNPGDVVNYVDGNGTTANVALNTSTGAVEVSYDVNNANATNATNGKIDAPTDGANYVNATTLVDTINKAGWNVFQETDDEANLKDTVTAGDNVVFANGTDTLVNVANDGNTTTITYSVKTGELSNNANGTVSFDAANGSVATVDQVADAINNSGWNTTLSDGTQAQVNPGDVVNYTNGTNTVANVTQDADGNINVSYDVAGDLTNITSITNNAGNTITVGNGTTTVNTSGTAAVDPNSNATDIATIGDIVNTINNVSWTVAGNGEDVEKITAGEVVNFVDGNNTVAVVTANETTGGVDVTYHVEGDLANITSISNNNGTTISLGNNTVNVNNATISNVAEGVNGTDAVNVNQLNSSIASVTWKVTGNHSEENATVVGNGTVSFNDSDTITANVEGMNISFDVKAGDLSSNANGTVSFSSSNGSVATVDQVADAINNSGWQTTLSNGNTTVINPGNVVNYSNGTNTVANVTQDADGNINVSYDVAGNLTNITSITNNAGNTITVGNGTTITNTNGTAAVDPNSNATDIATIGDIVNTINNVSWTVAGNGEDVEKITAGEVVNFVNGNNTVAVVTANA
ncbi:trimeric autotransporter adhesin, partial [Bibersteinia trehalosi]|uniref:ESPR-type extended signal peptide-containing protein n=1 Tax=Bibersteinia trehalosi TaxID=47735 RepID=UPI0010D5BE34